MNDTNLALLEKNRDILSIRDLATGTIATYTSYLTDYINWVEENLPGRSLSDVTWEDIRSYEKYLKDVRKLNPCTINVFISHLRDFYKKRWLPFVKETFNGRGNAVSYLARYSYRTAISNSRIRGYDDSTVTFEYKDYRDGGKTKTMTVSGMEFIRRFLKHVLPSHFSRIRYSGYLTNCRKTFCLKLIHMLRSTIYPGNPYRTMNNPQRNE